MRSKTMNTWLERWSNNAQLLRQNRFDASQSALHKLWALTWREAQTLSYADAFRVIMACFIFATLRVPLMRKAQPPAQPSADAHCATQ
ncbi:hypothetical protein [Pseudomonas sp. KU43P]|uniref:hypothetical protein n=1 Tax=Pseudomonas sp. KU43P TaxID=2487887 RepID=UPI0012A7A866|nr:hypothetical protein [Pseudomonas sp. KU43P]BBH46068.1 hypothetical protein KU43P_25450 [Pseudomonas sp. KU43P]